MYLSVLRPFRWTGTAWANYGGRGYIRFGGRAFRAVVEWTPSCVLARKEAAVETSGWNGSRGERLVTDPRRQ
jgi:hypothetical protein